MGRGRLLWAVLVPLVFTNAPAARADPLELLRGWAATAEACDVMRDQIRIIAQAKRRNPAVTDAALLGPVARADRTGLFAAQPRPVQLAIVHNMATFSVGKYRDPVSGGIDPEADANQFFIDCTLALSD
jgi:hypothetical protein